MFIESQATQFYLLRHAQGFHNVPPVGFTGDWATDPLMSDAELTEVGHTQTLEKQAFYADFQFDEIYVSPLKRCRQTLLGVYPRARNLTVIVDDRLIEQPAWDGVCNRRAERADVIATSPVTWDFRGVAELNPFGHTSLEVDHEKIRSFTKDVLKQHPGGKVFVVAHAGWIWRWFEIFKGISVGLENCQMVSALLDLDDLD
jgi:broad specificity phosphatase PhoE